MLRPLGVTLDWLAFADTWRGRYEPSMAEVRSGAVPFSRLDVLHRRSLASILPQFGVAALPEPVMDQLTLAWHRLDAWPDVAPALARLRQTFLLAPCSNGNIALQVGLARRNGFHWDAILGAEVARDFKPKPAVYLASAEAFGLAPEECMMVAAHSADLAAASALGLRAAHVARPQEFGPDMSGEPAPVVPVDFAAASLADLADQFGA